MGRPVTLLEGLCGHALSLRGEPIEPCEVAAVRWTSPTTLYKYGFNRQINAAEQQQRENSFIAGAAQFFLNRLDNRLDQVSSASIDTEVLDNKGFRPDLLTVNGGLHNDDPAQSLPDIFFIPTADLLDQSCMVDGKYIPDKITNCCIVVWKHDSKGRRQLYQEAADHQTDQEQQRDRTEAGSAVYPRDDRQERSLT